MVSSEGGMNIEEVAEKTPELIFQRTFRSRPRPVSYQVRKLAEKLGLKGASVRSGREVHEGPVQVFVQYDCSLVGDQSAGGHGAGELIALDAKMTFDDNAMFRHKDLDELRDLAEEDPPKFAPARPA